MPPPQTPDPLGATPPPPNPPPAPQQPIAPPAAVPPVPVPAAVQAPVPKPPAPPAPAQAATPVAPTPAPAQPASGAAGHVDLGKILLPKKQAPGTTVDSAQRVNAGVLFEQEQSATLVPEKPAAQAPVPPPKPKAEQPIVRPLETFQGDIESLVGEKQVSVVSIAAAEADRRAARASTPEERKALLSRTGIIAGSVALCVAAIGIGAYIVMRLQPVPLAQQAPAPFMLVDDTETVTLNPDDPRPQVMQALVDAKDKVSLSLGLVARLLVAKPSVSGDGSMQEVGAPEFLQTLAPSIPAELVRTLEPQMLLGVHSYDENQAFMILKVDSYETAYSGMLAWEGTMRGDLSPLFTRTPAVRIVQPSEALPAASSTATTTATTTPGINPNDLATGLYAGNFLDQVVENHDARVALNQNDDILLLWTFLDRSTIVITTNAQTLREVISRISQASIISLPAAK